MHFSLEVKKKLAVIIPMDKDKNNLLALGSGNRKENE
jgi:hypothetical protein